VAELEADVEAIVRARVNALAAPIKAGSFKQTFLIKPGKYTCSIDNLLLRVSSNNGLPYVRVLFKVVEPTQYDNGRFIYWTYPVYTTQYNGHLIKRAVDLGFPIDMAALEAGTATAKHPLYIVEVDIDESIAFSRGLQNRVKSVAFPFNFWEHPL
jgi:hypothetical protein